MSKSYLLLTLLIIAIVPAWAQQYMYVNTDNLILRDRPEKVYNVFAILHAPCRVKIEPYEQFYNKNHAVTSRFYDVSITYEDAGIHHYLNGWVEKKYLVADTNKIDVPGAKMNLDISESEVIVTPYIGDDKHNPNYKGSARDFQAPKYKGGEKQPEQFRKIYQKGPRGGCYYINAKGKKVYVKTPDP